MSLTKFNGNGTLPSLLDEFVGKDMEGLHSWSWPAMSRSRVGSVVPSVNIREDNDNFYLEVAAPGMKKKDFNVVLDNGRLTIYSEKREENEEKDEQKRFMKREFSYHAFSRSFWLPDTCEQERIEARYTDGILHLTVPKKEEAKPKAPRQIKIT
ncbi:Hsp20/alpha crystallin family protein [Telluribacter humicola]|uniref:Hsp20/alpha crystallin family protein n=1 Tax=Telluribacter humicola TaxID=1720261 RepID=UPI001A978EBB|nr:Hsp20/alpha crystallin family protein [Telluribacter humicola]